jgi:hypothetical protein
VENCNEIMLRAIGCGGQVIESKIDVEHNFGTCTIEGPEGILIYVSSVPRTGFTQQSPTEWLMSKIALNANEERDRPEPVKIPSQRMSFHPRPIIHTLDVSLFSKNGWIPCPPNARKPTPFETDVRLYLLLMRPLVCLFLLLDF